MSPGPAWTCGCCGHQQAPAGHLTIPLPIGPCRYEICAHCGTAGLGDRATARDAYDATYYGEGDEKFIALIERMRDRTFGERAALLVRESGRAGGRVLDIGCGDGRFLAAMAERGWQIAGTELPGPAFDRARRIVGLDLREARDDLVEREGCGRFDIITLWHVLEHLPNPRQVVSRCAELMEPGGLLIVEVPNFSSRQACSTGRHWMHLDPPRHLYQYTEAGLRAMLADAGFVVQRIETFSLMMGALGWIQSVLNAVLRPRDVLYRSLHAGGGRDARLLPLVASWLALVFLGPPALALTLLERFTGRGPVLRAICRR
jgi:2-polyprenyl-3-methyl-5-hydroxy-6-metoxy-1,4-benzoquinol methylase